MTGRALKLGVLLPTRGVLLDPALKAPPSLVLDMARRAEEAGLDSVWAGDSLTAKPRLEPLSTLAAVASATSRVRLGTAVLLAPLRHPVLLAQTAASVDLLSGGRLVLGMGVGGAFNEAQQQEWQAAGIDPTRRGQRMTEMVQVLRRLWTGEPVHFAGRHFQFEGLRLEPRPAQPGGVPMLLACHHRTGAQAQFRRAGRHADGVISITDSPSELAQTLDRVRDEAAQAGRDTRALSAAFYMTVNINAGRQAAFREADDFIRRYYGLNVWAESWGPFGEAHAVASRIAEYAGAGAGEVIVRFASFDPLRQLDAFVEHVMPRLQETPVA